MGNVLNLKKFLPLKENRIHFFSWTIFFFLLAVITLTIQFHIPLHNDNSFFIYAARQLLMGGTYTRDFFDTNPPLIILLNIPIVLLAKSTLIDTVHIFYFYILFLGLGSLAFSCYFLKQIITDRIFYSFIVGGIAIALLVLPNCSFGQREHLCVVLSMPYLFAAVLRLANKPINLLIAILIGIFAGIGFALKPYFLTTFILLELFFIFKKRNIWGWVRPESICVASVIAVYMGIIYLFFSDYVLTAVPMLLKYYITDDWRIMLVNPFLLYSLLIFCVYGMGWKKWSYPILSQVLMLALLGSILSLLISHVIYFYHALPMISFATLLAILLLENQVKMLFRTPISLDMTMRYLLMWLISVVAIFFIFPIEQIDFSHTKNFQLPLTLFALSTIVFFAFTLQKIIKTPITKFFLLLAFILTLAFSAKPFPQPDQLYIMLIFPYFCGILLRLHHQPIDNLKALIIGVTLGIALSLNYYLFIPVVLTECFFFSKTNLTFFTSRIELITSVLVAYGLATGILQPVLKIIGLNIHWLRSIQIIALFSLPQQNTDFIELFNFSFCCFVLVMHLFSRQEARYLLVRDILFYALLGFVIYAFIENLHHNLYATLPAIIISSLLITLILGDILNERHSHLISSKFFSNTCKFLTLIFAWIFLLFYPTKFLITNITESASELKKGPVYALASFLKAYPNSTYDFYALDDGLLALDLIYKQQYVGRFPMLWWYPPIAQRKNDKNKLIAANSLRDEKFFINGLADKLNQAKPRFVITQLEKNKDCVIDVNPILQINRNKMYDTKQACKTKNNPDYNYIKIFSSYDHFKKAWIHYRFLTDIFYDSEKVYVVYERV